MRHDIRYAGLAPESERRLRLAAKTLAVKGVDATVNPWEGVGCRVAVVDAEDAFGRHVLEIARRRKVPVLAIVAAQDGAPPGETLPQNASISAIAQALHAVLVAGNGSRPASLPAASPDRSGRNGTAEEEPGLLEALGATLRDSSRPIHAKLGARSFYVVPDSGRVVSNTMSDLLELRGRFCDAGWTLVALDGASAVPAGTDVSTSLDSYLVAGAASVITRLPAFPDVSCALTDWPDLASADTAVNALRVAAPLMRRALTCRQVSTDTGIALAETMAYFWAFRAAGILRETTAPTETRPAASGTPRNRLWSRLAQRFGLS
jgi:hypothetical protein